VEHTAICGSDLHVYRGLETGLDAGTVMGHEFVGRVVEASPRLRRLEQGQLVVSPFTTSCGGCYYCTSGLTARCLKGGLFGWVERGRGLDGAQAEYVRVPLAESTLVAVPEGLAAEQALLAGDVLATGSYCAELAELTPNTITAVVGCGPVGLMGVVAARERGVSALFAIDSVPERLRLAERLGAAPVNFESDDPVERLRAASDGRGADAVLELVGSPDASRLALNLVRPGGVIAAAGVHNEARFAFSPAEVYDKNLTYRAGRCPARRLMEPSLQLLARGRYPLGDLISHRLDLAQGARAYELFDRRLEGCTKVLLNP
jgi:threonine dehydrogenase-like Zn-dependent dehydrogenase